MMKKLPPVTAPSSNRPKKLEALNNTFSGTARSRQLRNLINESNASHFLQVNQSYIFNSKAAPKDIQKSDLSTQLKMLRKDYDRHARSGSHHEQRLSQLRQELIQLDTSQSEKLSSLGFSNKTIQNLQEQIKKALKKQKMEENNMKIYKHILDRMRTTSVHLARKSNKIKNELKNRDLLLKEEVNLAMQANTARSLAKNALRDLKNTVKDQRQVRLNDVEKLRSDISHIQQAKLRKQLLSMEQKQKLEQAFIKESSQQAEHLKQGVYLHRLWYFLINKRFQKESKQWQVIENAFQQIKISTGLNEITRVVEKFLTKEQTLDELMRTVRVKQSQLEDYKDNIEKMQKNIDRFVVDQGSDDQGSSEIQQQLQEHHKVLREVQGKYTDINKTHEKILTWLQKILQRINNNLETNTQTPKNVVEAIQMIRNSVKKGLSTVADNKQKVYDRLTNIKSEKLGDLLELIPASLRIKAESAIESEDDLQGLDFVDQVNI